MGAVYCRKMALAAVVSLLAMTKRTTVAIYTTAPASWTREKVKRGRGIMAQTVNAAMALRAPAMAAGCQSTSLINRPPRLQRSEVTTRSQTARFIGRKRDSAGGVLARGKVICKFD